MASSRSDSSLSGANGTTTTPRCPYSSARSMPSESRSPTIACGTASHCSSASVPPSAATMRSAPARCARSRGSTSPCATTTAFTNKSGASERRSEVSRVPTPYADITQIRFWGLRLSALSAPRGRSPVVFNCACSVLPYPQGGCRGFSPCDESGGLLDLFDRHDLALVRWGDEPRDDEDREGTECDELHLVSSFDLRSCTRL